jgi:hypothetical protein
MASGQTNFGDDSGMKIRAPQAIVAINMFSYYVSVSVINMKANTLLRSDRNRQGNYINPHGSKLKSKSCSIKLSDLEKRLPSMG